MEQNANVNVDVNSSVLIEVGAGELIDKITILRIKQARIDDAAK